MKTIISTGLWLGLLGGIAMAQTAPSGTSTLPTAPAPHAVLPPKSGPDADPQSNAMPDAQAQPNAASAQNGSSTLPTPPAPHAVLPPTGGSGANSQPDAPQDAQAQPEAGSALQAGQPMPNAGSADEGYEGEIIQTPNGAYMVTEPPADDSEGMSPDQMQAQGPGRDGAMAHPHPVHAMRPPSKAAHFRIHGPDLALDVKCPEDEPVKACVDAASQLIDKASAVHH